MAIKELKPGVFWVGVVDGERRSFDELFPIPSGTTYNAYLVRGSYGTALVDTVDPAFSTELLAKLDELGVESLDYVVVNHAEQDHAGSLPAVLERYPHAKAVATPLCKELLLQLLDVPAERITAIDDGDSISLGDRSLRTVHFPWVHWPETMVTYLEEERVLFSCDLFGCHLALRDIADTDDPRIPQELKRYFACIMMPYRRVIEGNLNKISELGLDLIAPSHGPVIANPEGMIETYRGWVADTPHNLAVIPYVSMHGSTWIMVQRLAEALAERDVGVELVALRDPDKGALAMALVDAATVVLAAPTVLGGAHPAAADAAFHLNMLRPKTRFVGLMGSFGWSSLMREQLIEALPDMAVEFLEQVIVKGKPTAEDLQQVEALANAIARHHEPWGAQPTASDGPAAPANEDDGAALDKPATPAVDPTTRYRCTKCGWYYDPAHGDPDRGIAKGTPFADIPGDRWYCPLCGAGKSRFRPR